MQKLKKRILERHLFIYLFKDLCIYFREKECEREEGQRKRGRENPQSVSLLSVEPDTGPDPMIRRS